VPKLAGGLGVLRKKECLNRPLIGVMLTYGNRESLINFEKTLGERRPHVGIDHVVSYVNETKTVDTDYSPTKMPSPRVDADNNHKQQNIPLTTTRQHQAA
jgi:hypothetical protein